MKTAGRDDPAVAARRPQNGLVKSEVPSQDQLLDELDSGVDVSQIDERLALSPTERLERMRQFLVFLDGMKSVDGDRLRTAAPRSRRT